MNGRRRRVGMLVFLLATAAAAFLLPGTGAAHPLGNFTINHYAGVRVEPDRVLLDIVIDQAEIPTFQARLDFDSDGDGEVSDAEAEMGAPIACLSVAGELALSVDGSPLPPELAAAGLTFPAGVGGLSTMRSVCEFAVEPDAPFGAGTTIDFADGSFPGRPGWHEIVVTGSGVSASVTGGSARSVGSSSRLTDYPTNLLGNALADSRVTLKVTPGGPRLAPFSAPDARPLDPPSMEMSVADRSLPGSAADGAVAATAAPVPHGVDAADLPAIFRSPDLSPLVLLISIVTAVALGAGHALTPGHGKTLMAAYLVGSRGTALHAAGLGLSVTVSHTFGVLVLAAVVVGAQGLLAPDVVARAAPIAAGVSIVLIGGWMLASDIRRRQGAGSDGHGHIDTAVSPWLPAERRVSWRSLFVVGLAGGLIPSTSALLILLGSIAAGRPAFGFVLVVAFGIGMAVVLAGAGLILVVSRERIGRRPRWARIDRISANVPLLAAAVVFAIGLYLTVQAVGGASTT